MNAKDFLLTDPKIEEMVVNGYDIRLEENEWIEKMELYALSKQNSHKHSVGSKQPDSQSLRAAAVEHSKSIHKMPDEWLPEYNASITDFQAGAWWMLSQVAGDSGAVDTKQARQFCLNGGERLENGECFKCNLLWGKGCAELL